MTDLMIAGLPVVENDGPEWKDGEIVIGPPVADTTIKVREKDSNKLLLLFTLREDTPQRYLEDIKASIVKYLNAKTTTERYFISTSLLWRYIVRFTEYDYDDQSSTSNP